MKKSKSKVKKSNKVSKNFQQVEKEKVEHNIFTLKNKTVQLPRAVNENQIEETAVIPIEVNRKHHSSMNVINTLLQEKDSKDKTKLLSKRLKKQRQNYLLNSNRNLHLSKSRKVMTSLNEVKNLKKVIPNVRMHNTGIIHY